MDHIPDEVREDLESRANVVGTAKGRKRVDDRPTDEDAVIVLVNRKLPDSQLADGDKVPETVEVEGEEVKTDVQEVGDVRTQATTRPGEGGEAGERRPNRKRRWRPAPAGVSVGHPAITAGTMGTPPLETADGTVVTLTNRHVAAPVGEADTGDDFLQPGPSDGGTADSDVGELRDWSEVSRDAPNRSDSAVVAVDDETVADYVLGVGPLAGWTETERDATYTKSGRTTGVTTGELRARDARIRVNGYYDAPTVFEGVDVFEPMSAGGDSGSVIGIERSDGFYGTHLLFAGSDRSTIGVPMNTVQEIHGELTPVHPGGGDGGDGDGTGPGGPDDPTAGFRDRVGERLRERYGDAVRAGEEADFRVDAWPVALSVHVVASEGAALEAVGRALVAAGEDAHPVVVYPGEAASDRLRAVDAVTVVALPADGDGGSGDGGEGATGGGSGDGANGA